MEYTKGDWKHTEHGVIIAPDGKQIASVFPRDKEANAQLIAAAPKLVKACEAAFNWMDKLPSCVLENQLGVWEELKQALAKVKGE